VTTTTGRGLAVTSPKFIFTEDGQHCYAYSGKFASSTTSQTMINAASKDAYIIARFQCNGAIGDLNSGVVGSGAVTTFTIKFNEVIIARLKTETATEDMPSTIENELIIPPYTTVTVDAISGAGDSNLTPSVNIIGKVFD